MCLIHQNAHKIMRYPVTWIAFIFGQYFSTVLFQEWLIPSSLNMGIIPNNAINIIGTPFNLLVMFNAFMVHLKCHIIMCLCIALVLFGVVFDCAFRCSYTSIDQGVGVSPQYPDDPYYQPAEQGKRNPPSEHVSSYVFRKYFFHYNIACGFKCHFGWIRVSY